MLSGTGEMLLLGGWQILGINSFQTGTPRTITAEYRNLNSEGEDRPNVVPGVSITPEPNT